MKELLESLQQVEMKKDVLRWPRSRLRLTQITIKEKDSGLHRKARRRKENLDHAKDKQFYVTNNNNCKIYGKIRTEELIECRANRR